MKETAKADATVKIECSKILQFLAVISFAAGLLMALYEFSEKYVGEWMWAGYAVSGIFSGVYFWAMAIIVKAAEKYLSK